MAGGAPRRTDLDLLHPERALNESMHTTIALLNWPEAFAIVGGAFAFALFLISANGNKMPWEK